MLDSSESTVHISAWEFWEQKLMYICRRSPHSTPTSKLLPSQVLEHFGYAFHLALPNLFSHWILVVDDV